MKARSLKKKALRFEKLENRQLLSAVPTLHSPILAGTTTSSNWSGYAVTPSGATPTPVTAPPVTAVSGSWVVPKVTGSGRGTTYSSVWVGIDGYSSSTVEQLGTEQDVVNGAPSYSAWYEIYPNYSVDITTATVNFRTGRITATDPVKPGDAISASVTYSTTTGKFTLSMNDTTEKWTFSTIQGMPRGYTAALSSAEWIVEAPSDGNNILPLADFSPVYFTSATYTLGSGASAVTTAVDVAAASAANGTATLVWAVNMTGSNEDATSLPDPTTPPTGSTMPTGTMFYVTYVATTSPTPTPPSGHHHGGHGFWSDDSSSSDISALDAHDALMAELAELYYT